LVIRFSAMWAVTTTAEPKRGDEIM
jgi:hypothetical protein